MNAFLNLKSSSCKDCYKCIRQCPVKSIDFLNDHAEIIADECILCGRCYVVCPQAAKEISSEIPEVKRLIKSHKVFVSLAPSFVAYFKDIGIQAMRDAVKKLGFYDVIETAEGATAVKAEYERILSEEKPDVLISSCCPSVNLLVQKHFPSLIKYLAPVKSPMTVHAQSIKKNHPDAKVVFVGPCIAKKEEARSMNYVDAVLTFDELDLLLKENEIDIKDIKDTEKIGKSRSFPTTGGVIRSFNTMLDEYTYIALDGVINCLEALREIEKGNLNKCFVELSACESSCIGGPVIAAKDIHPIAGFKAVKDFTGEADFDFTAENISQSFIDHQLSITYPTEAEIKKTLASFGKVRPENELNCGSCGYDTCRDHAVAIIKGKADPNMCLHYLKEKAESFSSSIINYSPNAVIVLNDDYRISLINGVALKILGNDSPKEVLGNHISRYMDPTPFINAKFVGSGAFTRKKLLRRYDRYVDQTVLYNKEYQTLICNMRDITEEELVRQRKESITKQTYEIADKVVEKQMRIVQDIASLLGETAAETKIALFNLKESISDD